MGKIKATYNDLLHLSEILFDHGEQRWLSGMSARLQPIWPGFESCPVSYTSWVDRDEKRLRMRHLRPSRRVSAGKSRLEQQIPNVKSITERWRYFVDFLHDFDSFYFPKRFIYLRRIVFSGPYRWNFRKARDFVYFIDPLLCIVASRAVFSRHGLLTSR